MDDERYAGRGCALALEFKKIFMDMERRGQHCPRRPASAALSATVPGFVRDQEGA